jgi:hypothetical protein
MYACLLPMVGLGNRVLIPCLGYFFLVLFDIILDKKICPLTLLDMLPSVGCSLFLLDKKLCHTQRPIPVC